MLHTAANTVCLVAPVIKPQKGVQCVVVKQQVGWKNEQPTPFALASLCLGKVCVHVFSLAWLFNCVCCSPFLLRVSDWLIVRHSHLPILLFVDGWLCLVFTIFSVSWICCHTAKTWFLKGYGGPINNIWIMEEAALVARSGTA